MIIQQKRIRSVQRYLNFMREGSAMVLGVPRNVPSRARLIEIGFQGGGQVNDSLLPGGTFGPISRFNSQGKIIRHRDRPKIDVTHTIFTSWQDWHGDTHHGYVERTYHCYPSELIPPPGVELRLRATTEGEELVVADSLQYVPAQMNHCCHVINLFLELFGECHIFSENLDRIIQAPLRRLNWKILPRGQMPFEDVRQEIAPLLQRRPAEHREVIEGRMEIINGHNPNFVAVGQGGFTNYLVFGFPNHDLFLLESTFIDNATYVLGNDWERLSQMTKGELLDNNLVRRRVFHRDGWRASIDQLLA